MNFLEYYNEPPAALQYYDKALEIEELINININ
jgi:hypothetical protein